MFFFTSMHACSCHMYRPETVGSRQHVMVQFFWNLRRTSALPKRITTQKTRVKSMSLLSSYPCFMNYHNLNIINHPHAYGVELFHAIQSYIRVSHLTTQPPLISTPLGLALACTADGSETKELDRKIWRATHVGFGSFDPWNGGLTIQNEGHLGSRYG